MPLTEKGEKIKGAMEKQYGEKKGEQVFYASKNAGKITGVDDAHLAPHPGKAIDDYVELKEGKSRETVKKNVGTLMGAGHRREAAFEIAKRKSLKNDDNQHMGITSGGAKPVEKLTSAIDSLTARVDAFESRRAMQRPKKVEPRNKDNMQPSMPHPKEPREPGGG